MKYTRAGHRIKEPARFDFELRFFFSKQGPTSSGGNWKRVGTKSWVDDNTTDGDELKHRCQNKNLLKSAYCTCNVSQILVYISETLWSIHHNCYFL